MSYPESRGTNQPMRKSEFLQCMKVEEKKLLYSVDLKFQVCPRDPTTGSLKRTVESPGAVLFSTLLETIINRDFFFFGSCTLDSVAVGHVSFYAVLSSLYSILSSMIGVIRFLS